MRPEHTSGPTMLAREMYNDAKVGWTTINGKSGDLVTRASAVSAIQRHSGNPVRGNLALAAEKLGSTGITVANFAGETVLKLASVRLGEPVRP